MTKGDGACRQGDWGGPLLTLARVAKVSVQRFGDRNILSSCGINRLQVLTVHERWGRDAGVGVGGGGGIRSGVM